MRQSLDKALRKKLEDTVIKGRDIVEIAVNEALQRLGVADSQVPSYLNEAERKLRNKLRAHARQLGDGLQDGKQEIECLTNEMAYEHWHRMLFACYLEQNNLLMYDEYTAVTIEECAELAEEESDCKDGWEMAGRLAQKMLPQIFRVDSPVFEVKLSINHINELESLISKLDPAIYQAQDSLGWCYQFWQTKKKDQVNKSGVKIGAQELSPVTQLFTEPYMVSFLLDNALGAWWANKQLSQDDLIRANNEQELRELASIPGVPLEYLRFSRPEVQDEENKGTQGKWKPAVGGFEKWPEHLSELKTLDPCCGSGHFLVAVFLMLVPMRMQLESLTEKEAVDAVLRDNIHGLELDQRCVELAAFALALEAWRYPNTGGYRVLPELQLACSGMSITEAQKEWKDLEKGDEELQYAIKWMQETFKDASLLGSLINPRKTLTKKQVLPWELLGKTIDDNEVTSNEALATAKGLAKAAGLLSASYQWVVTNVPYLASGKQNEILKKYCEANHYNGRNDLATSFYLRCIKFNSTHGISSLVLPQNWMFSASYNNFRKELLNKHKPNHIVQLGSGAFDTISGEVVKAVLMSVGNTGPHQLEKGIDNCKFIALDVSNEKLISGKALKLRNAKLINMSTQSQLSNPSERIILKDETLETDEERVFLGEYCSALFGSGAGDKSRFTKFMWEVSCLTSNTWEYHQVAPSTTSLFDGRTEVILWENEQGQMAQLAESVKHLNHKAQQWRSGKPNWGKKGIAVSLMAKLPRTLYTGNIYAANCTAIVPKDGCEDLLPALWLYCSSQDFYDDIRELNPRLSVEVKELLQVKINLNKWKDKVLGSFPNGLPQPYSNDPKQSIFHGHPCTSVIWDEETKTTAVGELRQDDTVLQVAIARLLGYQWPAELDAEMELAPEMRQVMEKNADFAGLVDDDGIVCIPAVRGEKTATKRLEAILYKAYGDEWTSSVEANLLKAVKAKDLESWLRDKFFDQHCKLFQHRPFIWQIWDGLKDGFSALVNYHQLDYKGLERLIYTYLDDWISIQKGELADGRDGADIRLTAAENLKVQLEAILEGEEGLDIFVRWKPLTQQPIGWNPDLNDGVRLNIRPFMHAKDIGKKGAGVLRGKPNIHWKKDRGTDVESAPWFNLGLEYGGKQGDRINDHHLTLAEKCKAREEANG